MAFCLSVTQTPAKAEARYGECYDAYGLKPSALAFTRGSVRRRISSPLVGED
jgi:hypothetical protein